MMRFPNSASAEGASEENLAICAIEFLPSRPENDAVFISASAEGSHEENFAILMRRISAK